jgi:NADH:ubiquinone reductase (non-electrogenic)
LGNPNRNPDPFLWGDKQLPNRQKLVVLGTGFASFSLLKKIDIRHFDVVVVSPRNHFLFTPLLPSTTVGTLEFRSIIEPIRLARGVPKYHHAVATGIDSQHNLLKCQGAVDKEPFEIQYDILVIGVGAVPNTFSIPGVEKYALFLKELSDARKIRQRIIECFERASNPGLSEEERRRMLHFVVVGGGPTGVEFAAEMYDFLSEDLERGFKDIFSEARVTLLEASKQILSSFRTELGKYALKVLRTERIDVRTETPVREVKEKEIVLVDGTSVPYGLVVWCTGNGPNAFVQSLSIPKDRLGRILTDEQLRSLGAPNVYALGDCANIENLNMAPTAQVAQQQGLYLAKTLNRMARNLPTKSFAYQYAGMLAYLGGKRALADLPSVEGSGFSAWLFWRSVYLTKLVSLRNKVLVVFDWFKTFVFGRDISWF